MKKIILIFTISLCIFSCKKDKLSNKLTDKSKVIEENESVSTRSVYTEYFNDKEKVKKLMSRIQTKGDTLAYTELYQIYALSGHKGDFIFVSLFMANKYQYKQAYYNVYKTLNVINGIIINTNNCENDNQNFLDDNTKNFAIGYLKKAASKGHLEAIETLKEINIK